MKRRDFLKLTSGMAIAGTLGIDSAFAAKETVEKSKVYFSSEITPAALVKIYGMINQNISGKTAIKWHSGEPKGPNIIPRDMVKALQASIPNSSLVETNTYYPGARQTTAGHRETLKINGWDFCNVDIMDESGAVMLPINGGKHFKEMSIGKNMVNYNSMVVLTHFKGHDHGGFGGSLKNIAIGCADGPVGKKIIHGAGDAVNFKAWVRGKRLMENMVESAKSITDFFGKRIVYINVLRNMSVDCDCTGTGAAPVKARDMGILASTDILAIDKASVDMVYTLPEKELHDLRERFETREGLHQLVYMKAMMMGNNEYDLIKI